MNRFAVLSLLFATTAAAQSPTDPAQKLAPEEIAFARLPAEVRRMLAHLPAAQAMQTVAQTGQHAIALGNPYPTPEQFRGTLGAVLASPYSAGYTSASAGATSFPPLSPLVASPPPPFLR